MNTDAIEQCLNGFNVFQLYASQIERHRCRWYRERFDLDAGVRHIQAVTKSCGHITSIDIDRYLVLHKIFGLSCQIERGHIIERNDLGGGNISFYRLTEPAIVACFVVINGDLLQWIELAQDSHPFL